MLHRLGEISGINQKDGFVQFTDFGRHTPPERLYFYHSMDLPEAGNVTGHWDLRTCTDDYLGNYDFAGKRVLDCGVASGFLAFEMEKRGAKVTGLDIDEERYVKGMLIPWFDFEDRLGFSFEQCVRYRLDSQEALRNSFLLSRRLLGSQVELWLGDVMQDPIPVERADAALFGAILLHLNNPLAALLNVAQHVSDAIIITETDEGMSLDLDAPPALYFRPDLSSRTNPGTWSIITPAWLRAVLQIAGFTKFSVKTFTAKHNDGNHAAPMYCFVARR
ncbi:hypothetical protein SR870_02470 [Rhodopseudomonas palustris]|uniref:class I SAM-dependent methyltransferase n=1 Tax=Rhodopseudomonas palustris TaxID=1076 RepID=UPI002ACEC70C|nr:hypothetical protein [Rhodopseudomonas palustris]WQH00178.1 hypothetical protein SR870_02470 [Rhodopseudomonas palustris]